MNAVRGENQSLHSLDVTQTTASAMDPARLHCQIVAALQMRVMAVEDPEARKKFRKELDDLLAQLQQDTQTKAEAEAWGFPSNLDKEEKLGKRVAAPVPTRRERREAEEQADRVEVPRVGQHQISIEAAGAKERTTSLPSLTQTVVKKNHAKIQAGTKRALVTGAGHFNAQMKAQRWKPKLHLQGGSWYVRALAEPSACLGILGQQFRKNVFTCMHSKGVSVRDSGEPMTTFHTQ